MEWPFWATVDNSKVDILQQKIKEDPVVARSCYLPLNASILVHLAIQV